MSMEIKQHLKLSQQLVMTPQLQQAIKLLQLSRMELVDLVREEMMENPILEDGVEAAAEQAREADAETRAENQIQGETETPAPQPETAQKEVTGDSQANSEIDWDNYLENYSSAPSMPSYKANNDE